MTVDDLKLLTAKQPCQSLAGVYELDPAKTYVIILAEHVPAAALEHYRDWFKEAGLRVAFMFAGSGCICGVPA